MPSRCLIEQRFWLLYKHLCTIILFRSIMIRHLLCPALINISGRLSLIDSLASHTTQVNLLESCSSVSPARTICSLKSLLGCFCQHIFHILLQSVVLLYMNDKKTLSGMMKMKVVKKTKICQQQAQYQYPSLLILVMKPH